MIDYKKGDSAMRELEKCGFVINEPNERKVREELRETYGMEARAKLSTNQIRDASQKVPP